VGTTGWSQPISRRNRRRGWVDAGPSAASSRIPLEEKLRRKQERQRRKSEMTIRLEELKKKAKRAVGRAKARERRLYQFGQPLFPEDKHRELLAEIKRERNAILNEIRREVQEISAEGRRQVDLLQEFPRDSVLTAVQRSELGDRLDLIRSEFERANPQQIARKLEALHEHGSKVERFAAWMATNERRRALEEKGNEYAHMAFVKEFEELDRGLFEQAFVERTAGPAATVNAAEELAMFCYTRARDAQSMAGAYGNERYSVTPLIERQRYEHGGRVPVSAPGGTEPLTGQVANG
jgi:hypothetical protein